MRVLSQPRALVAATLAATAALLGASAALQLLSGGIRTQALGPVVLAPLLVALGCVIALHRPGLRLGAVLIVNGLGFALGTLAASALDYGAVHAIPRLAAQASFATVSLTRLLVLAWVLFILWFPDDRFPSRGWRRFFVAASALCAGVALAVWLAGPGDRVSDFYSGTRVPAGAGGPFAGAWTPVGRISDLLLALPLIALGALVQRYRRGDPVLRQQVRWLLAALAAEVLAQIVGAAFVSRPGALHDLGLAVGAAAQPLPMLAATLAILRYRLWDIDVVVSRALLYAALWALLSVVLVVPALAAGLLVGGSDALAAVALALLVTLAFQPARTRLERIVERIVYRGRPRGYTLLRRLGETLRAAVELEGLAPRLAETVRGGLAVSWAGVWLRVTIDGCDALRAMSAAGISPGPTVLLPGGAVSALCSGGGHALTADLPAELGALWPEPPAAVVPLVTGGDLVGLLACGQRAGDRLRESDLEVLELIARESALALSNVHLEAQLRERIGETERQAEELRRSRQRLVNAQDDERRRIERDLHDGAQQQLVALGAKLRRASVAAPADARAMLGELAQEAEDAVFTLQELARGIFPSVLADRGLAAALRTQAARLPLRTRVEVEPSLAGRRFEDEVESALYFVALEALANARKHAPGAGVVISLRGADAGRRLVLEVHDDGPGLDQRRRSPGTGLQNMRDRLAAAGGTLEIDSRPGAGTWVRAEAPLAARVLPLQGEADSRR